MHARRLSATIAACLMTLVSAPDAHAWTLGVGGQLYRDDAQLSSEKQIGPQAPLEEDTDLVSDDIGSLTLFVLQGTEDRLRFGGGLRYYGTYDTLEALSRAERQQMREDDEEDTREPTEWGTLFELFFTTETVLPIMDKLEFVLGTQIGLIVLTTGPALDELLDAEREDGASVLGLPRLGLNFGPQLGVRYQLLPDRLYARVDASARYNRIIVIRNQEEIDGVAYRNDVRLDILRYDAGLSLELAF